MAQTFTIDSIEGNSYIGVPVFSRFGQMQNYNYIVMSPQKQLKNRKDQNDSLLDQENEKYRLFPAENTGGAVAEAVQAEGEKSPSKIEKTAADDDSKPTTQG